MQTSSFYYEIGTPFLLFKIWKLNWVLFVGAPRILNDWETLDKAEHWGVGGGGGGRRKMMNVMGSKGLEFRWLPFYFVFSAVFCSWLIENIYLLSWHTRSLGYKDVYCHLPNYNTLERRKNAKQKTLIKIIQQLLLAIKMTLLLFLHLIN